MLVIAYLKGEYIWKDLKSGLVFHKLWTNMAIRKDLVLVEKYCLKARVMQAFFSLLSLKLEFINIEVYNQQKNQGW